MSRTNSKTCLTSIFCIIFLPFCAILAIFTGLFYHFSVEYQRDRLIEQLISRSKLIMSATQSMSQVLGNTSKFQRIISSLGAEDDVEAIVIASGSPLKVIASTKNAWLTMPIDQIGISYLSSVDFSKVISNEHQVATLEDNLFVNVVLPIEFLKTSESTEAYSQALMFLRFDLSQLNKHIHDFKIGVLTVCLSFMMIMALFSGFLIRKFVNQPLDQILKMIVTGANDEIEPIVNKFRSYEFKIVLNEFRNLLVNERKNKELLFERNKLLEHSNIELNSKNQLITAILDNVPVALFLKDIENHFNIALWNTGAENIFAIPREMILGKNLSNFWPIEQTAHLLARDEKVTHDGVLVDISEEEGYSQNRGAIFLRTRTLPLSRDCNLPPKYLLYICDDITAFKTAQKSLEIERAKSIHNSKLASLGEMAAGIAHEINNPLTIIYGTARALPKVANDPGRLAEKIGVIDSASQRVAKIVTSLRKFSRSSDKSDFKPHKLSEIIQEVLILTNSKSKQHSVQIEVECDSDHCIFCDGIEIEQVLINLVNNSVDAVKNLTEKWVNIEVFDKESWIFLRVRDSGTRIDPEVEKKLFHPFFTTKPVGEGTGLGLSIVKGILDEHHATIELLADDPNTCFEIRFKKFEEQNDGA